MKVSDTNNTIKSKEEMKMATEKINEFLQKIKTDPKTKELLKSKPEPETPEDKIKLYAELAAKLGFDLTEEDFLESYREAEKRCKEHAEKTKEMIEAVPDSELAAVSGGDKHPDNCESAYNCNETYEHDHTNCKDTFEDYENCWVMDGCDKNYQDYNDYLCENEYNGSQCSGLDANCNQFFMCHTNLESF